MINTLLLTYALLVPTPDTTELLSFIPEKHMIIGIYAGDINNDKIEDVILVTGNDQLVITEPDSAIPVRTTTLLIRDKSQKLQKAASNNNVVLCHDCGGVYGNPFVGVDIKEGVFTVNHYGGASTRWTINISFVYDPVTYNWYYSQLSRSWYNIYNMEEEEEEITIPEEKISFGEFNEDL